MASSRKTSSSGPVDHSSLVGGSTADRRIGCPASYQNEQKVPEHVRSKSSTYADEGTALHAAMQFIFENDILSEDLDREILGREFEGVIITAKHIEEAIEPCVDYIEALMDEYADEGEFRFVLETRGEMPGIPGAFGTSDFIFRTDKRSGILDYKFGVRYAVKAFYKKENGVSWANRQLSFYGRTAIACMPYMFEDTPDWPVELHILQPRLMNADDKDKYTSHTTTVSELEAFRLDLIKAIDKCQSPNPQPIRGDWCTFASCKLTCPLHTGAVVDMAKLKLLEGGKIKRDFDFDQHLGLLMELWDVAKEAGSAIMQYAEKHLEAGGSIIDPETGEPGWKLVPKRGTETVVDEEGLKQMVASVGVKDAYEAPKLKSPAQLGKAMVDLIDATEEGQPLTTKKAKEEEARRRIRKFTSSISSGNNIARRDDKRVDAAVTPAQLNSIAEKLAHLNK